MTQDIRTFLSSPAQTPNVDMGLEALGPDAYLGFNGGREVLPNGGTTYINLSLSTHFFCTLTENIQLIKSDVPNLSISYLWFKQGGPGSHTVAYSTGTFIAAGGTFPSVYAAPGSVSVVRIIQGPFDTKALVESAGIDVK